MGAGLITQWVTPVSNQAYVDFAGDMGDYFDDIAKNGKRIGQP